MVKFRKLEVDPGIFRTKISLSTTAIGGCLAATQESISDFTHSLSTGLGKVHSRFLCDAVTGIQRSQSLNLKEISRALGEDIDIHATEKRLSRNLADTSFTHALSERLLARAVRIVGPHTLLVVQSYSLVKKYASKMRLLHSADILGVSDGYQVCEIIATDLYIGRFIPIYSRIWSRQATGYISDADEILQAVRTVAAATGGNGMFYANQVVGPHLVRENINSINQVEDDLILEYRKQTATVATLTRKCPTPFGNTIYRYDKDAMAEEQSFVQYGVLPVHMAGTPRRLSLMAFKSVDGSTALLFANNMRHRHEELYHSLYTWLEGLEAGKAYRDYKEKFNPTSFRVLTYEKLQNLMTVLQAAIYYESGVLQEGLPFETSIRFRPHPGDHRRNYLIPDEKVPHSRFTRTGPWWY